MAKLSARSEKGDGRRVHRVEREVREVIGIYLLGRFKGDLPGSVTVSRVIASRDLRNAKVLVVMSPEPETAIERSAVSKELQAHAYEIQNEVNHRLRMKHCPRLTFHYDTGFEHALKVENILRDLSREREAKEKSGASGDET